MLLFVFFFSSRRRHTRWPRDWSSDVCSSDLLHFAIANGLRWPNLSRVLAVNDFQPGAENTAHTQLIRYGFEHGVKRSQIGRASCREREKVSALGGAEKREEKQDDRH